MNVVSHKEDRLAASGRRRALVGQLLPVSQNECEFQPKFLQSGHQDRSEKQ